MVAMLNEEGWSSRRRLLRGVARRSWAFIDLTIFEEASEVGWTLDLRSDSVAREGRFSYASDVLPLYPHRDNLR